MSQLRHWEAVAGKHEAVSEFLAWLQRKYGLLLDFDEADSGTPLEVYRLIDEFFAVDRRKLGDERRELLAAMESRTMPRSPTDPTWEQLRSAEMARSSRP